MSYVKRIFLFLLVNAFIVFTISTITTLLGFTPYLRSFGMDYTSLAVFCALWGTIGAFISLALSKKIAKWTLRVKTIDASSWMHKDLFEAVERLAKKANLPMPEVGIYPQKEVNAFATGPTKKQALVAISQGMLDKMPFEEIEAVIAHELSHIKNGDMVTMTLLQGVVNAFVMFLARALAFAVSGLGKDEKRGSYLSYILFVYLFEVCFMILGSLVVSAFSRFREYRADLGAAKINGKEKMISALKTLEALYDRRSATQSQEKAAFNALKISSFSRKGFLSLFATHPSIENRIKRLKESSF